LKRELELEAAKERRERQLQEDRELAAQREIEYKERIAKYEAERKEAEAVRAEKEKARNIKNFIFLKLVKNLLQSYKQVEAAKLLLVNHKSFSVSEAFRLFD
jgi:hypothetical protein